MKKGIRMCYAHLQTSHKECIHYVLQTGTNNKRQKKNLKKFNIL